MARTLEQIRAEITTAFIADQTIIAMYGLIAGKTFDQQFSVASVESLLFDSLAFQILTHEQIVSNNAQNSRPHTINWYKNQCLNFLDGLPLVWLNEQFQYDLTNVIDADVRKIIDRCAILESNSGELVLKLATNNNGNIEPLTSAQLLRFTYYINQIKDAGNRIRILNQEADQLKIALTVYVDPLIIDLQTGALLSGAPGVYPIKKAIDNYLETL